MWRKTADGRRPVLGWLCVALAACSLLPLVGGILHLGTVWPAALLLLCASVCFWPHRFRQLPRPLRRSAAVLFGLGLAAILTILMMMGAAARSRPDSSDPPGTVIVLGCQVNGSRPSLMLRDRIEAAYAYLAEHPEAVCIASGGLDNGEVITEAQCIRDTLVDMGIAPERIYLEDRSRSTYENLTFSNAIIREMGLDARVALASDNFHQYRGQLFARRVGLSPCSVGCPTFWPLAPGYWAREIPAILAAWIRGY